MINEPQIEVTCDSDGCSESITVQPEWVFASWSEKSGYYDCKDAAVLKLLKADGWSGDSERQYCESCSDEGN